VEKIRVGILGAGNIAEKHLEVLQSFDDVELAGICNSGNPRIHTLAQRLSVSRTFADYRRMLDEVEMDAAFVLVSVTQVAAVTTECLTRGLPVLIEKPPALSIAETEALTQLADRHDCLNMVALNRRFYSVMQRAREAILEAGPLVSIVVEAPERIADYRAAGHPDEVVNNILFANGIHCIDLFRYFGGEVAEVKSESTQWFESQKDSYNALLRFENGATGHYISNWTSPGRWSVNLYGQDRKVTLCPLERGTVLQRDGQEYDLPIDSVDENYKPGIYAQARYFIDCVRDKQKLAFPAADLNDAVKTMKLVESIRGGSQ
jgi:predicted dehydrogenase